MNIDSLSIQISASSTQAEKAIDKLIGSLTKLDAVMSGFNVDASGLVNFASALEKVSGIASSLNPENIKNTSSAISSLAKSASTLNTISNSLKADPFKNIASSLASLENVSVPDFGNLSEFANTVNKLGYKSSSIATDNIKQITTGLRDLSSVSMPNISGIGEVATEISKFGYKSATSASYAIPFIADGLRQLASIPAPNLSGFAGIGEFAKEISRLGTKSIQSAVEVMPRFATAFNQMMSEISRAPHVSRNVTELTTALANLARELRNTNTTATGASKGLTLFGSSAYSAQRSTKGLASTIGKIYASYFLLFRGIRQLGKATKYASDLVEVQNVIDQTFGDKRQVIEDFSKVSIRYFGMAELQAKQVASRFQAMGKAMDIPTEAIKKAGENLNNMGVFLNKNQDLYNKNITSMADMSTELTKLTADMGSFYNMNYEDVAKDMESIFTGQTRPMRTYGIDLTQANLKQWALEHGMNANLKTMTQWEKTLLRYQYVLAHTTSAQGDFLRTYNTWANVTRTIGQQFQQLGKIIGTGVVNTFKPLLIAFKDTMNTILDLAEKTLNALGKIFGWQIEISDVGIAEDYADAIDDVADGLGDSAKNAKKLKDYVLGIDELNIFNPNQGNSGGGGASGGGAGASGSSGGAFNVKETERFYESDIDSLFELGDAIGNKLKEALQGIDWKDIFQGAKDFGTGLASFLNGLISPELFYEVGKTIANSLNTAIYSTLAFAEEFDFSDFGKSIGAGINGFFQNFDFSALAKDLNTWVDGIEDAVVSALKEISWKDVIKGAIDFTTGLEIDTITFTVGAIAILGKRKTIKLMAKEAILDALGLSAGAGESAVSVPLGKVLLTVAEWAFAINPSAFVATLDSLYWDVIDPALAEFFSGTFIENFNKKAYEITDAILAGIGDVFKAIGSAIAESIKLVFNWDTTLTVFDDARANFEKGGMYAILGVVEGILSAVGFIVEPIADFFTALWNGFCNVFGIHSPATSMEPIGMNIILGIFSGFSLVDFGAKMSEWWDTNVAPWFTVDKWSELGASIIEGIGVKWQEFSDWWSETAVAQWWEEHVAPWFSADKWSEVASGIREGINTKWTEFENWWNNTAFKRWWDGVTKKFSKENWTFQGVIDGIKLTFKNAVNGAIAIFNKFIDWVNEKMKFSWDDIVIAGQTIVSAGSFQLVNIPHIPTFEEGGYPDSGSFFWAGENGVPELLGTIGGQTAVASGSEITGIRESVENSSEREVAMMERFIAVGERIIQAIEDKDFSIGDADIALANNRGQTLIGIPLVQ